MRYPFLLSLLCFTLISQPALCKPKFPDFSAIESAEKKGYAIAEAADWHNRGYLDFVVSLEMILKNKKGDSVTRSLRIKSLEGASNGENAGGEGTEYGEGDSSIIVFDEPADQRGIALLSTSHLEKDDDQYLFLPSLKRAKKVASRNRSGPFAGSEFTFEDLSRQIVDKFTYQYISDDTVDGMDCYVIDRRPKDEYSGYERQRIWVEKDELRSVKIEFYEDRDKHQKTALFKKFKLFGDYWRATEVLMENHKTGRSTTLIFSDYKFANSLNPKDFTQNSLKRVR